MKRMLRLTVIILAALCAALMLTVVSSAYFDGAYGDTPFLPVGDDSSDFDTPLLPVNPVWQVTHDNGYKEYSSTFVGGFELVREGSVMKLIPDHLNVNLANTFTVPTNTRYTIDLGSSTIVFTNKDIRTAALFFGGVNDVTLLSDGARVFLQEATSSFMTFNDNSRLTVFGGEGKLSVWAPDALELGGNAHAELHDVYFYKNHANMRAVLGVRGNSSAELYDSLIFTEQNRVAILMQTGGRVKLTNTSVISADNTNILDFEGNNISFTASGECYLYGKLAGAPKSLSLSGDVYTSFAVKDEYLSENCSVSSLPCTMTFATTRFAAPGQSVDAPTVASFSYRVMNDGRLTESEEEGSVWRIDDGNGAVIGYADTLYYPFRSLELRNGMRLTLLKDIIEPALGCTSSLDGEITIDLGANSIVLTDGGFRASDALFSFDGEGRVEILAEKSQIILDSSNALLRLGGYVSADISFADSYHIISCLATAVRGDVTVRGGTVLASRCLVQSEYGSVTLDGVCLMADAARVLSVGGELRLLSSSVLTEDGSIGCERLFADSSSLVVGEIEASSASALAGARFSAVIGDRSDFFLRGESLVTEASRPQLLDGRLSLGEPRSYVLNYIAVPTTGNILANLTLDGSAALNVYVPTFVTNGTESFSVRIVHDGLVYSEGAVRRLSTFDGIEYFVYSYPYIYQSTLLEDTRIDLVCDGILVRAEISPKELALSSLEGCRDEHILRGAAAYLSYALLASHDPDIDAALAPLDDYLPEQRAVYAPPSGGECIRSVYFNAEESTLDVYLRDGVDVRELRFYYGGEEMSAFPTEDGVIRIPMYRLDRRSPVRILLNGAGSELVSLNIIELYAIVSASPSRSAELFGRYIAYLAAI